MTIRKKRQRVPPAMAALVASRYGNDCWLGFPGCTVQSTTTDHITPFNQGGLTVPGNLRRACRHCNSLRGERTLSGWSATIHAVIGPPQGGKSSWVKTHAKPGDIVLDMDMLATAMLAGLHNGTEHVEDKALRKLASSAWYGAYRHAVRVDEPIGVWLVKTIPATPRSPKLLDEWVQLNYDIRVCDPGKDEVLRRQHDSPRPRAEAGIRQWYRLGLDQQTIDARLKRRRMQLASLDLINAGSPAAGRTRPEW